MLSDNQLALAQSVLKVGFALAKKWDRGSWKGGGRIEGGGRAYSRHAVHMAAIPWLAAEQQAVNDSTLASVCYTVFIPALTQP